MVIICCDKKCTKDQKPKNYIACVNIVVSIIIKAFFNKIRKAKTYREGKTNK